MVSCVEVALQYSTQLHREKVLKTEEKSVGWGKICGVFGFGFFFFFVVVVLEKKLEESYNFLCHWKIISWRQCVAEAANRLFSGVYPNKSFNCSSRLQPQARFLLHHLCLISLREKNCLQSHSQKHLAPLSQFYCLFPAASKRVHHLWRGWPHCGLDHLGHCYVPRSRQKCLDEGLLSS